MADNNLCTCNNRSQFNPSKSAKEHQQEGWNPFCKCLVHCHHIKWNENGNVHVFVM